MRRDAGCQRRVATPAGDDMIGDEDVAAIPPQGGENYHAR